MMDRGLPSFLVVHGAWHGAWCWEPLGEALEHHGARWAAPDLPCDDPNSGLQDYTEASAQAARRANLRWETTVVVGHSFGGLTAAILASRYPVRMLVYLAALVPEPGLPIQSRFRREPEIFAEGFAATVRRDELERSYWPDEQAAREQLFTGCTDTAAAAAFRRLRPQARRPSNDPSPVGTATPAETVMVVSSGDRAISPAWSRRVAAELGVRCEELDAGHAAFLSCPEALADLLLRTAAS